MCGIFGYSGIKNSSEIIHKGLKRLEYRGYDSWGISVISNTRIVTYRNIGPIEDTIDKLGIPEARIGIGHTRWATNGGVTVKNSHPHTSSDKTFVLAHNGIVSNYTKLKNDLLKQGYKFKSETDTEVIVALIETIEKSENRKNKKVAVNNSFLKSVALAFSKLEGRNTILILNSKNNSIVAVRNGSPLVIGYGDKDNDIYFSSDTNSFSPWVKKITVVENGQLINCMDNVVTAYNVSTLKKVGLEVQALSSTAEAIDKEGFKHFMIKEIYEIPSAIRQLTKQDPKKYSRLASRIKTAKTVYFIGSGTSGYAASQMAYYLRSIAGINAISLVGAEATSYYKLFTNKDLIIAPSQSGETADVLEVLEVAKKKGVKIASFVNMSGSTMTAMSDYKFMIEAGPEICVLATKVFASKLAWGYLLANYVLNRQRRALLELECTANTIERFLKDKANHKQIKTVVRKLSMCKDIFLLGKGQNLNIVLEGMVKIIEGSYIHAHAIPAGDLKHYAITLMEKGMYVIGIISKDENESDMISALNEIKARGAKVIGISSEKNDCFDIFIKVPFLKETSALINIIPLQLLAYYLATKLGHNVDKPRNIAKSVTVK